MTSKDVQLDIFKLRSGKDEEKKFAFAFAFLQCKQAQTRFLQSLQKPKILFPINNIKTENSNFSHSKSYAVKFSLIFVVQKVKEVDPLRSGRPHTKTVALYLSLILRQHTYYCNSACQRMIQELSHGGGG